MRAGGVLQDPVPQPAHQVRQAAAEAALPEDGLCLRDRAALLREAGGQDADRDSHQGHAAVGEHVPVADPVRSPGTWAWAALRLLHVTQRSAAPGLRDVHLILATLATPGASPSAQVRAGHRASDTVVSNFILIIFIINHDDGDICHENVMKRDVMSRDTCQTGAQGRS